MAFAKKLFFMDCLPLLSLFVQICLADFLQIFYLSVSPPFIIGIVH